MIPPVFVLASIIPVFAVSVKLPVEELTVLATETIGAFKVPVDGVNVY
jgi:hypothetical protein